MTYFVLTHKTLQKIAGVAFTLSCAILPQHSLANTRHFTYALESGVLAPGAKELEVWTTIRSGREEYYSRLDHRLEFEVGVANNLMTAFYLNLKNTSEASTLPNDNKLNTKFSWAGFSNEWKWKLQDPVADPVGLALYGELTYKTDGFDLESKILMDKSFGNLLVVANAITEFEFSANRNETELEEIAPDLVLGGSYHVGKSFSAGVELRNHNVFMKNAAEDAFEFKFSALYAGPVVTYFTPDWWVTLSLLPQLPALYKKEGGSMFILDDGEKINSRLLFSFHI